MDDERFDGLYLNVAQTTRGIEPLLDSVFSFLRRKTDFFSGPPGAEDGAAAAIAKVHEVLQKHADRYKKDRELAAAKKKAKAKQKQQAASKPKPKPKSPPKAPAEPETTTTTNNDDEIIEMSNDGGFDASTTVKAKKPVVTALPSKSGPPGASTTEEPKQTQTQTRAQTETQTPTTPPPQSGASPCETDGDDAEGPPPEGNGGTVPGKYVWTQTLSEVMVGVPVPEHTRGRDVKVAITPTRLTIALRAGNGPIVDAPLTKKVICDDSFWTIEDGNRLVVNLQKLNQMEWWESVCVGDPAINVRHIRPENSSLSDLDGETRKTVEKMMFDQRQKALGRPTSDEQSKLDALEIFKKQHPEMDFSNAKIS